MKSNLSLAPNSTASAFCGLALAAIALIATHANAAEKIDVRGATKTDFQGWPGSVLLESKDAKPRAVVVPGLGGRVMAYGLGSDNILWVNPNTHGRTFAGNDEPFQPGGFTVDLGPEGVTLPPHPMLTLGPWSLATKRRSMLVLKAPDDKKLGVEFEREIAFEPTSGELGFVHRIKNGTGRDGAFTLWHRIACKPGGFVLFPLNPKSRFPAGWSVRTERDGRHRYDGEKPEVPGVTVADRILVARTGGTSAKIGADSDGQWLAYAVDKTLFVIHFPIYSGAVYAEGGNSITVSWDGTQTELQPMGAESRLRSGKSAELAMKWSLIELPAVVVNHEDARALAREIPGSPFL